MDITIIRWVAEYCAKNNSGELRVALMCEAFLDTERTTEISFSDRAVVSAKTLSDVDLDVIQWAAEECKRQMSGEISVANMCDAWLYLYGHQDRFFDAGLILELGSLVEPDINRRGYRNMPVRFANGSMISASHIDHQIDSLCEFSVVLTPEQWYTEFEKIHPFLDGNGRVGSLIFNLLSNTLLCPIAPPDVFSNSSPPCLIER